MAYKSLQQCVSDLDKKLSKLLNKPKKQFTNDLSDDEQFSRMGAPEQEISEEAGTRVSESQDFHTSVVSESAEIPINVLEELTSEAGEDIDLNDLNEFADELNPDSATIDTSFIDEALEE